MKSFIKRYSTKKSAIEFGWIFSYMGILYLTIYSCARDLLDDLGEVSWVEVLLIVPALFHVMMQILLETMKCTGIFFGLSSIIVGVILLILTFPYRKRIKEVKSLRLQNGGKLPDEFLLEMYQSGELSQAEYEKELENNLKLAEAEKNGDAKKTVNNDFELNSRQKRSDLLLTLSLGVGSILSIVLLIPLLVILLVLLIIGLLFVWTLFG